jgi:hypothetical protein
MATRFSRLWFNAGVRGVSLKAIEPHHRTPERAFDADFSRVVDLRRDCGGLVDEECAAWCWRACWRLFGTVVARRSFPPVNEGDNP